MSVVTTLFGALLSLVGVGAFVAAPSRHITALFPAFLGAPMALLGITGQVEGSSGDAARLAAGIAGGGLAVSLQGLLLPQLFKATAPGRGLHPQRRALQMITAVLCGAYLAFSLVVALGRPRGADA